MKVAVTGATGFIGRHVLAELASHAVEIVAIVRPSSTKKLNLQESQIVSLDIHESPIDSFERIGRPDILIHLAWDGLPNYNSLHHFERELPSQYRFLKHLVGSGLKNLVVAGTCFEYGMQSGPLSAVDHEAKPVNSYGLAKNSLRLQLQYLQSQQPFALTWARLFYLYGEGQFEGSLYSQLKRAAEQGEKVFNMSGGEQLRDYMGICDAAKQLVHLALSKKNLPIVNICSGTPISVRKLVEQWIKENHWEISLNLGYFPYSEFEPMAFWGVTDEKKLGTNWRDF